MNITEFFKKNAGTILTVISAAAFVGTVIEVIKDTPKALKHIEEAKAEKHAELTKFECVQVTAKDYIPAIVLGTLTIGTMFGANALNIKQQYSMTTAYALLNEAYKKHKGQFENYRTQVRDIFGADAELKVGEKMSEENHPMPEDDYTKTCKFKLANIDDDETDIYFEATLERVKDSIHELNRELQISCNVPLNFLTECLGIGNVENGNLLGWNYETQVDLNGGFCWIDFDIVKSKEDELDYEIYMMQNPTPGFEDYDENMAYIDHKYFSGKAGLVG